MKDLVEFLVARLVENPEEVEVVEIPDDRGVLYEVRVASTDMGRVIGREGRVAGAIRTLVKSIALRQGTRVRVEFLSPEEAQAAHRDSEPLDDDGADLPPPTT